MSSSKPTDDAARALALLTRVTRHRVRSRAEACALLSRHGFSPTVCHQVIARCDTEGLLDDVLCAKLVATSWADRGYAWGAIRMKLSAKGIGDTTIAQMESLLGGARTDVARADQVAKMYQERARRMPLSDVRRETNRLARRLAARGFDAELIEQVLKSFSKPDGWLWQTRSHSLRAQLRSPEGEHV